MIFIIFIIIGHDTAEDRCGRSSTPHNCSTRCNPLQQRPYTFAQINRYLHFSPAARRRTIHLLRPIGLVLRFFLIFDEEWTGLRRPCVGLGFKRHSRHANVASRSCTAVNGAFDQLQSVNVPFDWAVAPGLLQCSKKGFFVAAERLDEVCQ
jgi:hypothetical protein